jgi:hypothetical protein
MTLLHEAVESKKLDVRVVERNISRGSVRAEDYEKSLKALPDDSENAEYVNIETLAAEEVSSSNGSNGYSSTQH